MLPKKDRGLINKHAVYIIHFHNVPGSLSRTKGQPAAVLGHAYNFSSWEQFKAVSQIVSYF